MNARWYFLFPTQADVRQQGNLGHSDNRMVDKHCADLAPPCGTDVIRSTAPDLA
jgi:hypothetical protein